MQIQNREALTTALEAGAAAVAVRLPRDPPADWWIEAGVWQSAARRRNGKFYLLWDRLVREAEFTGALQMLGAVARMNPDALVLRDAGLAREARLRFPHLLLHAAGSWGFQNSPGLRLAETLGFGRVVLDSPLGLKDLALLRRQSSIPLAVALPPGRRGYSSLCLAEDYLGRDCDWRCDSLEPEDPAEVIMASLEMLSGLCQLEVEAVQVRSDFLGASLKQALGLYQAVWEAPAAERPQVLAAAREVLAAFGHRFRSEPPNCRSCQGGGAAAKNFPVEPIRPAAPAGAGPPPRPRVAGSPGLRRGLGPGPGVARSHPHPADPGKL